MLYLSKGKRGVVYLAEERGKRVVVKVKRDDSAALRTVENEVEWLKILNKRGIGPRFIRLEEGKLVMEYIEGEPFVKWHMQRGVAERERVVREIFRQCRMMDILKVNKLEMHSPVKHIIIRRGQPVMIDFERCKKTLTPKNVTQFCQFLLSLGYEVDREALRRLLKAYKKTYREALFRKIVGLFVPFRQTSPPFRRFFILFIVIFGY